MAKTLENLEGRLHATVLAFALLLTEVARIQERTMGKGSAAEMCEKMLRKLERQLPGALAGFEADGNPGVSEGFEEQTEILRATILNVLS